MIIVNTTVNGIKPSHGHKLEVKLKNIGIILIVHVHCFIVRLLQISTLNSLRHSGIASGKFTILNT